jgi:hypothetical protein
MTPAEAPDAGLERADRYEQVVRHASARLASELDQLAECQHTLATLVRLRATRAWALQEHETYLLLRRARTKLQQRALKAQRTLDFARNAMRDRSAPPLDSSRTIGH